MDWFDMSGMGDGSGDKHNQPFFPLLEFFFMAKGSLSGYWDSFVWFNRLLVVSVEALSCFGAEVI